MSEMKTLTVNGKAYALVDTLAREQLGTLAAAVNASAPAIVCNASGSGFAVSDSADRPLQSLRIFGKTVQGEDPSPDAPQALVSVGDGGSVGLTLAGKNLWDEETVLGYWASANGKFVSDTSQLASKNMIPVAAKIYCVTPSGGLDFVFYNRDKVFISSVSKWGQEVSVEPPVGAWYMHINLKPTYGTEYRNDVMISAVPTSYEPNAYKPYQSLTVSTPNGLPGIPVASGGNYTDEHGQMWICDEMDYGRGVYVQRVQTQEIKSNAWAMVGTVDEGNWKFGLNVGTKSVNGAVISERFPKMSSVADGHANGGGIYIWENGYLEVVSPSHTAAEEFREWGWNNPIVVMYALATPIETPLDADTLAAFDALHTYKPATTVLNDAGAHMEISYVADTKAYIDRRLGL